jgi:sulfite exporter TauE/SafE
LDEHLAMLISRMLSGVFLLALGFYLAGWTQSLAPIERAGNHLWQKIKPIGARFMPIRNYRQAFLSGLVWGWLPCGLVYSALVWALSASDPLQGMLIMGVFGLATLPALFITGLSAVKFSQVTRNPKVRRGLGATLIVLAMFHLGGYSVAL